MLFQSNFLMFNFLVSVDDVLYSDIALRTLNTPLGIHKATPTHTCSCTQLCTNWQTKASTVKLELFEIISVLGKGFKFYLMLIVLFRLKIHSFSPSEWKEHKFIPSCKTKHLDFLLVHFLARVIVSSVWIHDKVMIAHLFSSTGKLRVANALMRIL